MTSSVPLRGRLVTSVLRPSAPPLGWGIALATGLIVVEILLVLMLKRIAPENAFGAVFLFGVLVVSAGWGFRLSMATAVASTAAYAYIHVVESRESLVPAVVVFLVLALLTNVLVGQSRLRAMESDQRRREADLLAALARTMLRTSNVVEMLDDASVRLSAVLDLPAPYAKLGPADAPVGRGQRRIVLRDGACVAGSLLVPAELTQADARRVQRIVPSLEALLAAVRDRGVLLEQTLALARQQASLRRVATLVASRAEPDDVHHAVAAELADGLDIEHVSVVRYDDDDYFTILAARDDTTTGERLIPGERFPVGGYNVCTIVETSGAPIAIDFTTATGAIAGRLRGRGLRTGIGVPINVDGRTWGAVIIGGTGRVLASDVEDRLTDFADLLATAVYNGETRRELTRSRARVVAAADKARRTIERDLHDGAQQRIVTLGMELRGAQAAVPDGFDELRISLARTVETLAQVNTDLRELSRGIHPAILSRGGLAPALKTLARRSPIPVALTAEIVTRLTDSVEVAAYYVVAEALTNTAKYADASVVTIAAVSQEGRLDLTISDGGRGGADAARGGGVGGGLDRVAAVGGTLTISSPVGGGTTITVRIDPSTS